MNKARISGLIILFISFFLKGGVQEKINFWHNDRQYQCFMRIDSGHSRIFLQSENQTKCLSADVDGDHIFPAIYSGRKPFLYWVNYSVQETRLLVYDIEAGFLKIFPAEGFGFLSSLYLFPVVENDFRRGFIFLGTKNGQDDIFFADYSSTKIFNLTNSRNSESEIRLIWEEDQLRLQFQTTSKENEIILDRSSLRVIGRQTKPRTEEEQIIGKAQTQVMADQQAIVFANSLTAFGDSITAGKMRMNDLIGDMHPELAYPEVCKQKLVLANYGLMTTYNRGVGGDTTADGKNRIVQDLQNYPAYFFAIMLGTNDTYQNSFSLRNSVDNMEYILKKTIDAGSLPLLMTIPPRNDFYGSLDYVKRNIADFNGALKKLATGLAIPLLDIHKTFMDYQPPNGWKKLLEDIGGNHPSPSGHELIASLLVNEIISAPPILPSMIKISRESGNSFRLDWQRNYEYDFSHYELEYGWSSSRLTYQLQLSTNSFVLKSLPFLHIYFRLRAVDRYGNKSGFTTVYCTRQIAAKLNK